MGVRRKGRPEGIWSRDWSTGPGCHVSSEVLDNVANVVDDSTLPLCAPLRTPISSPTSPHLSSSTRGLPGQPPHVKPPRLPPPFSAPYPPSVLIMVLFPSLGPRPSTPLGPPQHAARESAVAPGTS
ncbi:hypothetical protein BDQ17DRAFT_1421513 [Cyathus striatus]|nr:hypothetical protein BDQ17DRAFT_1421513 [Cyathus striatus]